MNSSILVVPEGKGEKTELEVFDFTGQGGVSLAMYNTDEVGSAVSGVTLIGYTLMISGSCRTSI